MRVIRHRRPNGIRNPWFMSGVQHTTLIRPLSATSLESCGGVLAGVGRLVCAAVLAVVWALAPAERSATSLRGRPRESARRAPCAPGSCALVPDRSLRASTARSPGWSPRAVGLAPRGRAAGRPAPGAPPRNEAAARTEVVRAAGRRAGSAARDGIAGRVRVGDVPWDGLAEGDAEASGDEPGLAEGVAVGFGVGRGVGTGPDTGGNATGIGRP